MLRPLSEHISHWTKLTACMIQLWNPFDKLHDTVKGYPTDFYQTSARLT